MTDGTDIEIARRIGALCYGSAPTVEPAGRFSPYVFRLRYPDGAKIVKLAPGTDPAPIRKEACLIDLVAEAGIPAPTIEHRDPDGERAGRAFLVMASAGDRVLLEVDGDEATHLYGEMGRVLAKIHGIPFPAPGMIEAGGVQPHDWSADRERFQAIAGWLVGQNVLDQRDAGLLAGLPMPNMSGLSLCHGDFHAVQCVVAGGRIAAVLDWDGAWAGNPEVDLAIAHAYTELYAPTEVVDAFLKAYAAERPISAAYARESLPVRMAHMVAVAWVMQTRQQPELLKRAVTQLRVHARTWADG